MTYVIDAPISKFASINNTVSSVKRVIINDLKFNAQDFMLTRFVFFDVARERNLYRICFQTVPIFFFFFLCAQQIHFEIKSVSTDNR